MPEAIVIIADNSEWMRNGDYTPSRIVAQSDAISLVTHAKFEQNPENSVALLTMAGKSPEVLVTLTQDQGKLMGALASVTMQGDCDILAALQVAQLVLKHKKNPAQQRRVVVFVGSPINAEKKQLVRLAKQLKKNNVAVDIVNFGEVTENADTLEAFIAAVNSSDNSHHVSIPPTNHLILSDALIGTPLISGFGDNGAGATSTGGAASGSTGGVDPTLDPELAMALEISMKEELARRAKEDAEKEKTQDGEDKSAEENKNDSNTADDDDDDDEMDEETRLAIEMSKRESGITEEEDEEMDDYDEEAELELARQLSLAEAESNAEEEKAKANTKAENKEDDVTKAMNDPNFVNALFEQLPGVDPSDSNIKQFLETMKTDKGDSKEDDSNKKEDKKE